MDVRGKICVKCKERAAVSVVPNPRCFICLEESLEKRFKTTLRMQLNLRRAGGKVALAFSGGHASLCLSQLLLLCVNNAKRKMFFDVHLVHVDESDFWRAVNDEASNCYDDLEKKQRSILESMEKISANGPEHFSVHSIQLSANLSEVPLERLVDSVKSIKSPSDRQEILDYVRMKILANWARVNDCEMILMGDCADRTAVHLVSQVCTGRGFEMPSRSQYIQSRFGCVFGYPLRDITFRDILLFNRHRKLEAVPATTFTTLKSIKQGGIAHLCENFIFELQAKFPGTVANVLRTAEKLIAAENLESTEDTEGLCVLCGSIISKKDTTFVDGDLGLIVTPAVSGIARNDKESRLVDKLAHHRVCHACSSIAREMPMGIEDFLL